MPRIHVRCRIGIMQQRGLEPQESNDLGTHPGTNCPLAPVFKVRLKV